MDCNKIQDMVECYLDQELALSDMRIVEEHVTQCANCKRLHDNLTTMKQAINQHGKFQAPSSLKLKVRKQLKNSTDDEEEKTPVLSWLGFSGGIMAIASLATWLMLSPSFLFNTSASSTLQENIVTAHVHSLMVDHVLDIASADQHTVKPWFNGKLDFVPQVKDLSNAGYALLGGRLEYIQNRIASAIVYSKRDHIINVFMLPTYQQPDSTITTHSHQGYNIVNWSGGGLDYWAISDLNKNELLALANIIIMGTE